MEEFDNCVEDLKMFMGLPPFDKPSNLARGDAQFRKDINTQYNTETLQKAKEKVGLLMVKWYAIRRKFIQDNEHLVHE